MVLAPTSYHDLWVGSGVSRPEGLLNVKAPCLGAFTASLPPATLLVNIRPLGSHAKTQGLPGVVNGKVNGTTPPIDAR